MSKKEFFTKRLMGWHDLENDRALPWKLEKDPYRIWLSEVILQQTRAEQGTPYYLNFVDAYPTIHELAAAPDEEVFRLWQGLGYYNRCKNLLATARYVAGDLKGSFPDSYEGLLGLKGIGPYTAAAIASFAYGKPNAVVDGNVNRVLARFFGIEQAIDSTEGRKLFQSLAGKLLDKTDPGGYNQAIMDLGATVCIPTTPRCTSCPVGRHCVAKQREMTSDLPVKSKAVQVRKRHFHYLLLIRDNEELWIRKRIGKDIWQNLYEPLLVEHQRTLSARQISKLPELAPLFLAGNATHETTTTQRLTHQLIELSFFSISLEGRFDLPETAGEWVNLKQLKKFPFPRSVVSFLEKKFYF